MLLTRQTHRAVGRFSLVRDWSLITGRGGATKWENRGSETFCAPPPQDRVKLFAPLLLKGGIFFVPPITMAKTSSSHAKTTSKLFVPPPPFSMVKTFSTPPFHRGKTSHAPPPFCSSTLPVISDQSLMEGRFPWPRLIFIKCHVACLYRYLFYTINVHTPGERCSDQQLGIESIYYPPEVRRGKYWGLGVFLLQYFP